MKIDHIGIVVKSIEKGIDHWTTVFGYRQRTAVVTNSRQKVRVVFMTREDSTEIKLIEPSDETSPVHRFALKGGGLHHLCFKCDDLEAGVEQLKGHKLRMLTPPQPGEAFANEKIAFFFAGQGLNIELVDTDKRAEEL